MGRACAFAPPVESGVDRSSVRGFPDAPRLAANESPGVAMHLEIEMPDRASAFQLEDELKQLYPLAVGRHGVWQVELDDEGDHLDTVVETTRRWLRACELEELVVRVDGAELHVHA